MLIKSVSVAAAALALSACGTTVELGLYHQPGDPVYGRNPVASVRLKTPLWEAEPHHCLPGPTLYGEYEHLSSIRDIDDLNVTDQFGLTYAFPLGRRP